MMEFLYTIMPHQPHRRQGLGKAFIFFLLTLLVVSVRKIRKF
ncbi:MAG: hypothetical protein ACRCR9_01365 [Chitinophagaceae bacterium]